MCGLFGLAWYDCLGISRYEQFASQIPRVLISTLNPTLPKQVKFGRFATLGGDSYRGVMSGNVSRKFSKPTLNLEVLSPRKTRPLKSHHILTIFLEEQ